ncbi:Hypothetical protein RY67_38 [Bifidobacterium longum subsp. infantis]|uniref:Uncharacterized protein n=1 Tax=Bifidobacterium longum subsp. infantis TaxID=1682 RepID=A0A0M3T5M4_BIFLI|nr:Hypothetical protein RY67_38 [Bifidobacterium longum subsp. infantis]
MIFIIVIKANQMPGMLSHDLNQLAEIPRFNEACAGFLPVLSRAPAYLSL